MLLMLRVAKQPWYHLLLGCHTKGVVNRVFNSQKELWV